MQIFLFIIVLFVLFVLFYLNKDKFLDSIQFNYKNVYELKKLFTNSEIKFYKSLQKYLENKEVVLFSKVRLADMLNIKK
ncbi:MAG: hypothetical protein LBU14_02120 [Candidatus Peribacteria bacterium]|jgi:hypothetical protein|nr:hypothetical protein [Candidatus Peribacteria bacterium]